MEVCAVRGWGVRCWRWCCEARVVSRCGLELEAAAGGYDVVELWKH